MTCIVDDLCLSATSILALVETMNHRRSIRLSINRRAAATVELALVLPLLIALFGMVVDFSRSFRYSLTLAACARNGAMYASDPTIEAKSPFEDVTEAALAGTEILAETPTVTSTQFTDSHGYDCVQVTVSYPFETILGCPGFQNDFTLSRTAIMRIRSVSSD